MDLGAFVKIGDLSQVMEDNGIEVPRLRGLRLMVEEKPMTKEEIEDECKYHGIVECKNLCESFFYSLNPTEFEWSWRTDKLIDKFLKRDSDHFVSDVRWKNIHGRRRKMFRYVLKMARRRTMKQYEIFNKYCGQEGILYIHARIGGGNWNFFGGPELAKQPWFIEKVDDAFDCTYCDIYARIGGC